MKGQCLTGYHGQDMGDHQGSLVARLLATNGCVGVGVSEKKLVLPLWSALASGLGLAFSVCRDYDAGVAGSSPHLSINEEPL